MALEKHTGPKLERGLKERENTVIKLDEICKKLQTQLGEEHYEYDETIKRQEERCNQM